MNAPFEFTPSSTQAMATASASDYVGLPPPLDAALTQTRNYFQALDNFFRVFAIHEGERVLMLTDPLLDPRVVDAGGGPAKARGATVNVFMAPSTTLPGVPEEVKPLIAQAHFVVSTWFCSIEDPFNVAQRKASQRWVKITYFRNLDLLHTAQARFPIELVGQIIRATERRFPVGTDFDLRFTDERGSDLVIPYTAGMRDSMFAGNRWRGKMFADEPGCYVHYLPTHGPNFWDSTAMKGEQNAPVRIEGVLCPQWPFGSPQPFAELIIFVLKDKVVREVKGESRDAQLLRDMC